MITAKLLPVAIFKSQTNVGDNVDPKFLTQSINDVQEDYVLPMLGTALYNHLQSLIIADPDLSSSPNYKTLLQDYIWAYMIKAVSYEAMIDLGYRVNNKGVNRKTDAEIIPADLNELYVLGQRALEKMKVKEGRLKRYLLTNAQTMFPLYYTPGSAVDTIYPKRENNMGGIYLGELGNDQSSLPNDKIDLNKNPYPDGYPYP